MAPTKRLCHGKKDRISDLPGNVMDCIFGGMSIRDAARTVVLSRKWRYIWASCPELVFDEKFFKSIYIKHKLFIRYEYPKAINKALFVHIGPILKFSLHIPNILSDLSSEIDQWMIFLSRNGIKELELKNSNPTRYILPSCILLCSSLIELSLIGCILKPPLAFEGFHYLVKLLLEHVSFSGSMSPTLLYKAPLLKALKIRYCTGIEHRSIHTPLLEYFAMVKNDKDVDWEWFESNKKLTTVQLELGKEVQNVKRTINMLKFLKGICKVRTLWLDGFSLKYLATANPSRSLATSRLPRARVPAPYLAYLRLIDFEVDDLDQISSAFCLLKSCPRLMTLELDVATLTDNVPEPVVGYLESSSCKDFSLDMLKTVKIRFFKGFKAELLFIKLLLVRSTSLQRMTIEQSTEVGACDGFKISRDLLEFTRASSRAKVIHVVDPR